MVVRTASHKSFYVLGLMFLLISVNHGQAPIKVEAQDSGWSTPQTIPGYDPATWPPILVADQDRTVYAFSSQPVDAGGGGSVQAVFYNRWTLEQGWTIPSDILLSPYKDARLTDAHLDGNGMFHVVFFGGDNTGADIYYSKAPAALADDPNAWSAPISIGENAGDPEGAVFYEGDQGSLYVMYNGRQLGNGLYVVSSKDGGENWSDPTPIFFTPSDEPNISQLHVVRAKSGSLHAVWLVSNVSGQGRGIYYARSDNGIVWSEPVLLADAQEGLGVVTPTIIEYNKTLIALYIVTPKITMRLSTDDGKTWSDPSVIFPRHVGVNGSLSLVIDGNNQLHLFFGQRISGNPDIHGMWHSSYRDNRWTEPDAVVRGPLVSDPVNHTGFDPYQAHAIMSQGNTILVTWRTDPNAGPNGVWYSYEKINAPELPVVELPLSVDSNNNPGNVADVPTERAPIAKPSPTSALVNGSAAQALTDRWILPNNPSLPMLVGTASAALLALIVAIIHAMNRGK